MFEVYARIQDENKAKRTLICKSCDLRITLGDQRLIKGISASGCVGYICPKCSRTMTTSLRTGV